MTTPANAPAQAQAKGAQAAPRSYPFPVGVYDVEAQDGGTMSLVQTTSPQQFPIYNITPDGWLRGVWFDFSMAVSGNATNSVSYSKDNPWSVINKVTLRDLGQQAVIGPIGGYDWLSLNKWGGYQNIGDPRADLTYTATTGTGSTAGSFTFSLYLPFEFVPRDSLGVVDNTSKPGWTVELWMDSQANTYNQVPSVQGTLTVLAFPVGYTKPVGAAPTGRPFSQTPPKAGTLQYWVSEGGQGAFNGAFTYDLVNGIAFPLRNWIYKGIDNANSTRATGDTDWPSPATIQFGNVIMKSITKTRWISEMGRSFGLTSTTADTAQGRENGVFPVWRTEDFSLRPGDELRYKYLNTQQGTLVRLSGTTSAAMLLYVLVNYIKPVDKSYYGLISA
jgi:hypothetical protein